MLDLVKVGKPRIAASLPVKVFSNVRNEAVRLPYFLEYCRDLGVSEFFIVDNGSSDDTVKFLESQDDVTIYSTDASFIGSRCGLDWLNWMRNLHGEGEWCLTLDCDELLVYPNDECTKLSTLVHYLDTHGYHGLFTIMLDFYANKPITEYRYKAGSDFLAECPYFDKSSYYVTNTEQFPYFGIYGGARFRVFYEKEGKRQGPTLKKIPLVKWGTGAEYISVTHSTTPLKLAPITGALLHFKYLNDFANHVHSEVSRNDRLMRDYNTYARVIDGDPELNLYCDDSIEYVDSTQLIELGLIRSNTQYSRWLEESKAKLESTQDDEHREEAQVAGKDKVESEEAKADKEQYFTPPKRLKYSDFTYAWPTITANEALHRDGFSLSVVMPVFNAERFLRRSIDSVINQPEVSELILAEDGSTDHSLTICEEYANRYEWIKIARHPEGENLGAGKTRNLGIENASGDYIAFLDADDYYLPGRFRTHKAALLNDPKIDGVYGCQNFDFVSEDLRQKRIEQGLPMQIHVHHSITPEKLFLKMNPIGSSGHFHSNTLTVKRSFLDEVGLFSELEISEDVEMWLRLAYAGQLVGLESTTAIASKKVHEFNRMNSARTKRGRPKVFLSVLRFAMQRPLNYERAKRLIERYADVTMNWDSSLNTSEYRDPDFLRDILPIIVFRYHHFHHMLIVLGRKTALYTEQELVTCYETIASEKLAELRARVENDTPAESARNSGGLRQIFTLLRSYSKAFEGQDSTFVESEFSLLLISIGDRLSMFEEQLHNLNAEFEVIAEEALSNTFLSSSG